MQTYSSVYERYFDPDHFSPGTPKTASRELPQACAYRALMSLKYKYHQDSRQPKDLNDLPTSAPLFDQNELTERAEQVMEDWTRRYPSQVAGTSDDVAAETKRQADQLWGLWSTKRNSYSSQDAAMPPLSAPGQEENNKKRQGSLPLSKLDQSYHTPQREPSPVAVPENNNDNERPPTESPDYDPGPKKSTLAAAAAAGVIGGGGGSIAASELAKRNNDPPSSQQSNGITSSQQQQQQQQQEAPDSPDDNDPVRVPSGSQPAASRPAGAATPSADRPSSSQEQQPSTSNAAAAAAGAQQPQPSVDKKIKISENDKEKGKAKNSNDEESDDNDKPKNTGGTKEHIAEQPLITEKGGLSGTQPVGKIDLKNL
ncbi:hypothetical protein O0I10_005599 [Lichtheimia ornata]|uniref:Uncharacterized protein n=1 Tax=Lichtheimia ornata TaxID=688661 RepID=A0AAD7V463_9FUNG|nr:uncharacterized protein O0I10_005599 [Lichtheimia ornata]KAJ8658559.1 hypothetical protein O0I10_005599 [Lichtheimia ornata]